MKQLLVTLLLIQWSTCTLAQLQSSVQRPCPGESVTFTCTIPSNGHQWDIPSLNITCDLVPRDQGRVITDPPFHFNVTRVMTESITSTATVTATVDRNGTLVVCRDGIGMETDQRDIIRLSGPPSVPTLSCVDLSEDVSGAVNVTVSWTLSAGDSADFYLINITTNAPQTPFRGLLNIITASVTQHELTGFMAGYEYNITVRGVNCGSLKGSESEPLIITPQVSAAPSSCNITLSYDQSSGRLLSINSTWDTVPDPEDPCQSVSGNISLYQITFKTGSVVATENVKSARCTAGRCNHTFEPPSNPPISYGSVSVAAKNVVGMGAARKCTTQTISSRNHLLIGEVVGVSSPSDARLNCRFISEFTGSAHCTVQYGTDPTYMNLSYSAESTETGTAGETVSVVLSERLNSSTVYYYTVSAVSGDVTLTVQGSFITPQYSCNLTDLWNLPAVGATFLLDVSLLGDAAAQYPSCDFAIVGSAVLLNTTLNTATVAYYTGTTPDSRACFVCNEDSGYEPNTTNTARICKGNGLWSENSIVCECRSPPWTNVLIVMGVIAIVAPILGVFVATVDVIIVCYIHLKKPKCCSNIRTEIKREWKNSCWLALLVIAVIYCAIGVALWIMVGVMVSNLPIENSCDPSWQNRRDGLIIAGFAATIIAYSLSVGAIWLHVWYHSEFIKKKKCLVALLMVAAILSIIGGVSIASLALIYIHRIKTKGDEANGDEMKSTRRD